MGKSYIPVLGNFNAGDNDLIQNQYLSDLQRFTQAIAACTAELTADFQCDVLTFGYFANPTSANITGTLPPCEDLMGKMYFFKNFGSKTLVIAPQATDRIDHGLAGGTISITGGNSTMMISNGIDTWYRIT